MNTQKFDFCTAKHIHFGCGSINRLGKEAKNLDARKILLVYDKGLDNSGTQTKIVKVLKEENLEVTIYDDVVPEPELEVADNCAQVGKEAGCNFVIGLGGGSTLDTAKAAAILLTNKGTAKDFQGSEKVKNPGLKTIMVPTTAGTGSETTPTAVFINRERSVKLGINSPYLFPDLALLDPELTLSLPPDITASTGMDALTHAVESYLAKRSSPFSEMFSLKALELIWENLAKAVRNGKDISARSGLLLGSCLAGVAIANAGVGAAHALSYPLSVFFGVPHGLANGVLVPWVMKVNCESQLEKFINMAKIFGVPTEKISLKEAAFSACEKVTQLTQEIGFPQDLKRFNIPLSAVPDLVSNTLLLTAVVENNPTPFDRDVASKLIEKLL